MMNAVSAYRVIQEKKFSKKVVQKLFLRNYYTIFFIDLQNNSIHQSLFICYYLSPNFTNKIILLLLIV